MRQHNLKTFDQIRKLHSTKSELFENLKSTFDYSLPQNWLDSFANWCKENNHDTGYYKIMGTTVWAYSDQYRGPVTCCSEVYDSWLLWELEQ